MNSSCTRNGWPRRSDSSSKTGIRTASKACSNTSGCANLGRPYHRGPGGYDPAIHPFFLRLMEKFDISYRLEDKPDWSRW